MYKQKLVRSEFLSKEAVLLFAVFWNNSDIPSDLYAARKN